MDSCAGLGRAEEGVPELGVPELGVAGPGMCGRSEQLCKREAGS